MYDENIMTDTIKTLVYHTKNFQEKHLKRKLQLSDDKILVRYDSSTLVNLTDAETQELRKQGIVTEKLTHDGLQLKSVGHLLKSKLKKPTLMGNEENDQPIVWIVEFVGPIKAKWLVNLKKTGAMLGDHLPPYSIYAYMRPSLAIDLKNNFSVDNEWPIEWMGRYAPQLKIEKHALKNVVDFKPQELIVHYFPWSEEVKKTKGSNNMTKRVTLQNQNVGKLLESEGVQYVEVRRIPKLFNEEARTMLKTSIAHDNNILGQNQIIAVTDTGIYKTHETMLNAGKITAVVDLAGDSNQLGGDGDGHGTHVACSTGGNSQPYNIWNKEDGQAVGSKLVDVKVFDNSGNWAVIGSDYSIWLNGYEKGARVNNNSWGSESMGQYTSTDREADRICSEKRDYVLVVAAGNSGSSARTVGSPAIGKNVLSVGASGSASTTAGNVASFSSRGPTTDGRIKPDILAPGNPIISAQTQTSSGYVSYNGTSMACPQISGLVALVRQYFLDGWYPTGAPNSANVLNPSSALVRAMIINGAEEVTGTGSDLQLENRFPNNSQGWGRANLKRTLPIAKDTTRRSITVWDVPTAPASGARWNQSVNVSENLSELKFTLVWTDPPAAAGAAISLVTNLHLRILAPNGQYFMGNNFTGRNPGYSIPGGSFDNRNPIEGIHLISGYSFGKDQPIPVGIYRIEVISANTSSTNNGFALVMGKTPNIITIPTPTPLKIAVIGDYNSQLTTLLNSQGYTVDNYSESNYGSLITNINNYRSIVFNRAADSTGFTDLIRVTPRETGLVFLGSYPIETCGLGVLSKRTGNPIGVDGNWGYEAVKIRVMNQHPILIGYQLGEEIIIINGGDNDYQTYQSLTNGINIAQSLMPNGEPWMVGVQPETTDRSRMVLLGSLGPNAYTNTIHWTNQGQRLFLNSVAWSAKLETKSTLSFPSINRQSIEQSENSSNNQNN